MRSSHVCRSTGVISVRRWSMRHTSMGSRLCTRLDLLRMPTRRLPPVLIVLLYREWKKEGTLLGLSIVVIAAGSITYPCGYVAALSLGADGICMGTRFLASKESYANDYYKQQLLHYTEADTNRTNLYFRSTWWGDVRCLNTPFHQQWKNAPGSVQDNEEQPIIGHTIIHGKILKTNVLINLFVTKPTVLPRFTGPTANPSTRGELEKMVMYLGQGVGLIYKGNSPGRRDC